MRKIMTCNLCSLAWLARGGETSGKPTCMYVKAARRSLPQVLKIVSVP